ncbi:P-loop containing nucleoside triphosphate hydrolase protein [Gloeopeniophorella convolvens]|nr:P-loop containing nucleoside triphosphate hydrolase protein [Gloeopeniophorella convolvens]
MSGGSSSRSNNGNVSSILRELDGRREALRAEIENLDDEARRIDALRREKVLEDQELSRQIDELKNTHSKRAGAVDYFGGPFDWAGRLREQMERIFGIKSFRLAQEGACNANMDGRDIVCIMPTGGGKSLTYQLPATLMPGCTLVVSPLISLMKDQIFHLREQNIEALMLSGGMSKSELAEATQRLIATATGTDHTRKEVKLCYVTPERIAKSNQFMSLVSKLHEAGKLARIVIDEAHCVSQWGHDYRPDYKGLSKLRMLYPNVPILALSATCPPIVLRDLLAILRLRPITDGRAADGIGTVQFTSPLYRKNLHYKVLPKPSASTDAMTKMVNFILACHPDDTGIVYCLTRADAENVAEELHNVSQAQIKTGVYHAEVSEGAKEELHEAWRKGTIKVVCATIAFGLGIDKADVRFVLHHSISKSIETFYQESGRAGRDGNDADCILYYRLQDAFRVPGMVSDQHAEKKMHDMVRFCLDMQGCRKLEFAKYFSSASSASWAEDNARCGHCDNCTRDPTRITQIDATRDAQRVLAVCRALHARKTKVSAAQLADTARGVGAMAKTITIEPNGRVSLSPSDTEALVAHMLIGGYLRESYKQNAYKTQVYLQPGPLARSLDSGKKLVVQLAVSERKSTKIKDSGAGSRKRKARGRPSGAAEEESEDAGYSAEEDDVAAAEPEAVAGPSRTKRRRSGAHAPRKQAAVEDTPDSIDEDYSDDGILWTGNLRGAPAPTHSGTRRSTRTLSTNGARRASGSSSVVDAQFAGEVIDISSD